MRLALHCHNCRWAGIVVRVVRYLRRGEWPRCPECHSRLVGCPAERV